MAKRDKWDPAGMLERAQEKAAEPGEHSKSGGVRKDEATGRYVTAGGLVRVTVYMAPDERAAVAAAAAAEGIPVGAFLRRAALREVRRGS